MRFKALVFRIGIALSPISVMSCAHLTAYDTLNEPLCKRAGITIALGEQKYISVRGKEVAVVKLVALDEEAVTLQLLTSNGVSASSARLPFAKPFSITPNSDTITPCAFVLKPPNISGGAREIDNTKIRIIIDEKTKNKANPGDEIAQAKSTSC